MGPRVRTDAGGPFLKRADSSSKSSRVTTRADLCRFECGHRSRLCWLKLAGIHNCGCKKGRMSYNWFEIDRVCLRKPLPGRTSSSSFVNLSRTHGTKKPVAPELLIHELAHVYSDNNDHLSHA